MCAEREPPIPTVFVCVPHAATFQVIACVLVDDAARPQSWVVKATHAKDVASLAVKRPVTAMPTNPASAPEPHTSLPVAPPEVNNC